MTTLKVVLIKPSKYAVDGYVERFKTGYMLIGGTGTRMSDFSSLRLKNALTKPH